MAERTLNILIDDRVRLLSAVLAATRWPEMEQNRKRHRAHAHARSLTRYVSAHVDHPALHTLQALLDQNTPLEALFTCALNLSWPDLELRTPPPWLPLHWADELADFYVQASLADWWAIERDEWENALDQTRKAVSFADLHEFFRPFVGDISDAFVVMPNVAYPTDREVGVRLDGQLFCAVPPRIAWGDNAPWPFDEDPGHLFRGIVTEFGRLLMVSYLRHKAAAVAPLMETELPVGQKFRETHPSWSDQLTGLFVAGSVAIFLEQALGTREAESYILMENKLHGLTVLPGVVAVLKRYLTEYHEGRYTQFAEYLPNFAKHLRVAKRVVSL